MPVGQSKLSYTDKSVHFPARLVAEFGSRFAVTARKFAVTFKPVLVNLILEGASHRAERHRFGRIFIADYEHFIAVVIPVPRNAVKVVLRHVGGFGYHKPALFFFVFDKTR